MTKERNILIVDDDQISCLICKAIAEDLGFTVFTVHSGEDAVSFCDKNPVDLILMDIGLPGMSGFDAAEAIKNKEPSSHKPYIMALTAHIDEPEKEPLIGYVDTCHTKPLTREMLTAFTTQNHI